MEYIKIERDFSERRRVRLINGETKYIVRADIVGYCHCDCHKGYVDKTLLKEHNCLGKNCPFLNKYIDNPFWIKYEKLQKEKAARKEQIKKEKKEKQLKEQQKEKKKRDLVESAQKIADYYGYPMKILNVKKKPGKNHYYIYYISDLSSNDKDRFVQVKIEFKGVATPVTLIHVKDMNGNYAVI